VRLTTLSARREATNVPLLLNDVISGSALEAEARSVHLATEVTDATLTVMADGQLLASAVRNLLSNAFKFTRPSGLVVLRAYRRGEQAIIEVEDECGGIPDSAGDPFRAFGEQRGTDRTGLGLGLSIARRAVRAHGGDIYIRNIAGRGCVFSIEIPVAPAEREAVV
jgi:signal transduction histidine kinase